MSDVPVGGIEEQAKEPGICVHAPCTCASPTEMYCSEACSAADGAHVENDATHSCACGHDDCGTTVG